MRVAFSVDYVERDVMDAETVRVFVVPIVKLADRFDVMATVDKLVSPAADGAVVRVGVVPVSISMSVFPGGEASSRGHANWGRSVRGVKSGSAIGDRIDIRSSYDFVAIATCYMSGVLVRHD